MAENLRQFIEQNWDLSVSTLTLFAERENRIFRLVSPQGIFAVKLARAGYHSQTAIQSELDFLDELARNNMRVAKPLATKTGAFLLPFQDQFVSISTWLDGASLGENISETTLNALGRELAKLHIIADAWARPDGFTRPSWDADGLLGEAPFWGRFWDNPVLTDVEKTTLLNFRIDAAHALKNGTFDTGLIHADAVRENVLVTGADVTLIDFDDFGLGYRQFELATVLLKIDHFDNFDILQDALFCGYTEERPLDLTELALFNALRACTYVGWIMTRPELDNDGSRARRFVEHALHYIAKWHAEKTQTQGKINHG